jgi:hypothetical protein
MKLVRAIHAGAVCGVLGAGLSGTVAYFVWGFFYAIGSRVITDETYETLEAPIVLGGIIIGVASGFASGVALSFRGALLVFGLNAFAVFAGCVCGRFGWRVGVAAVVACHLLAVGFLVFRSLNRCTKTPTLAQNVSQT